MSSQDRTSLVDRRVTGIGGTESNAEGRNGLYEILFLLLALLPWVAWVWVTWPRP
jgi:hypothetical protein